MLNGVFYDCGKVKNMATLPELRASPINTLRETVLIDLPNDVELQEMVEKANDIWKSADGSFGQKIQLLATFVSDSLGGPLEHGRWNGYKADLSRLKKLEGTNVLPLGKIKLGTYYHRSLLFKVVCDSLSILCSLNRGSFPIYWNAVTEFKDTDTLVRIVCRN